MDTLIDFLHLLGAVGWLGGIAFSIFVLMPSTAVLEPPSRGALMGQVGKRFAMVAWGCILILVVTGLFKLFEHIDDFSALTSTDFGRLISIKLVLVLAMIGIGAGVSFVLAPKMGKVGPGPEAGKIAALIGKLSVVNLVLGAAVLLIVALAHF